MSIIRELSAAAITDAVERLCIEANTQLPADVKAALDKAEAAEPWPLAKETLGLLQKNLCTAKEKDLPICQDTGMACVPSTLPVLAPRALAVPPPAWALPLSKGPPT